METFADQTETRAGHGSKAAQVPGARRWVLLTAGLICFDAGKRLACVGFGPSALHHDSLVYWAMGGMVARGDTQGLYPLLVARTPGYPAFLAACHWLFGSHCLFAVVCLQHLAGLATGLIAAGVVYRLTANLRAACLTYAPSALAFGPVLYANMVMSETLFCLLLVVHCGFLYLGLQTASFWKLAAAGLAAAGLVLVRPVAQLVLAPEVLFVCLWLSGAWRRRLVMAGALTVSFAVPVGVWCVRNGLVYETRPFLTHFLGRNLWIACFRPGVGRLDLPDHLDEVRYLKEQLSDPAGTATDYQSALAHEALRRRGLSDLEADDRMLAICRAAVFRAPGRYAAGCMKRFFEFWWIGAYFPPTGGADVAWGQVTPDRGLDVWHWPPAARALTALESSVYRPRFRSWGDRLYLLAFLLLTAAGLRGRVRAFVVLNLLLVLYFVAVTVSVEEPFYRYRVAVEPLLNLGIGLGATALAGNRRRESAANGIASALGRPPTGVKASPQHR